MKLNIRALAIAVGTTMTAGFAICMFFVAVSPEATAAFFSYVLHIDVTGIARPIDWGSAFAGLVVMGVTTACVAAAVAWLYNRFSTK